jgi:Holliday junction DNA helicase RuvA
MITFLRGILTTIEPGLVVLDVNGVGYELIVPLSSFDRLPKQGEQAHFHTHYHVREDAHTLYGFASNPERALFRLLISSVSGIGPKLGINVLNGISVGMFKGAVAAGDIDALSQISGVGKKTAQRIVVELKDKIGKVGALEAISLDQAGQSRDPKTADAVSALIALGVKPQDAQESVKSVITMRGTEIAVEEIVRLCLKRKK